MPSDTPQALRGLLAPDTARASERGPLVPNGVFSCVVDDHPRFHLDALRWFTSLTAVAGVDPDRIVVHVVGNPASDALDSLRAEGVAVRPVAAFDPRSPQCNKISGALRLAEQGVDGMAVLCDTDLAVLEDPRTLAVPAGSIAAKLIDTPVPPLAVLASVFHAAGVPLPPAMALPWAPGEKTASGNCNGGLYLVPGVVLSPVASAWERWARWLLDRPVLLEQWKVHLDQVAMALALAAEDIGFHSLDVRWNTPTHDLARIPADAAAPAVLHYHQELFADGRIRWTGAPSIDQQIERVNDAIGERWQRAFPNATFWEWRYLTDPDLGSGTGSRGELLRSKRDLLASILDAVRPTSVLDVACGDGEATRNLPMEGYIGIDPSAEAVRRAKLGRPDGEFVVGTLVDHPGQADLTLCLDMLIHQSDDRTYRDQIARLWESARHVLVVSGYERRLVTTSTMIHFHEPLSTTIRAVASDAECYPVRDVHGITTLVVLRPPATRHPRDYSSTTLESVVGRHPDPVGLIAIRLDAWRTHGFYPDHASRLWEYPVVTGLLRDELAPESRIVDVGAGISPLVPYLGRLGYVIDTVDPSPVRRTWPPKPDCNEWGFLDYADAGLAHRSWNCTLEELPPEPQFDGAYSVSVIQDLRAADRRALITEIATRVRPGGLVVLTIDLVRDGDDLWNRNRGVQVEEPTHHGTIADVVAEAAACGLELLRIERVRDWGHTSVDIGLLALRRTSPPMSLTRRARTFSDRVVAARRRRRSGS